jgi:hypothetical protein
LAFAFFGLAKFILDPLGDEIDPIFNEIDTLVDAGIEMVLDVEELVDKCKLDFDLAIQGYKRVCLLVMATHRSASWS